MYTKNAKRPQLVHSSSMFQPSLTKPDPAPQYKSSLSTSSCNSLSQSSRKPIKSNHKPNFQRSQSIRRSQFQIRSQSAGGAETNSAHRKVLSTQASDDAPDRKESSDSLVERHSVTILSRHFYSLMSRSSQVKISNKVKYF